MKISKILISQPKPEGDKSPYFDIAQKHKVTIDFNPFIHIEGMSASEVRKQRINLRDYHCVIFNSRSAVDHYFRMAEELRLTDAEKENSKYFCITEAVALYLQKYITYRKRKIFFAKQNIEELADVIKKNKDKKFLFPASDKHTNKITEYLDSIKIKYTQGIFYRTVSSDMKNVDLHSYNIICFFSPNGVQSLFDNFPKFQQKDILIGVIGKTTLATAQEKGLKVHFAAPMPNAPSMTMVLDWFLGSISKVEKVDPLPLDPSVKVATEEPKKTAISKKTALKKEEKKSPVKKAVAAKKPTATKTAEKKKTTQAAAKKTTTTTKKTSTTAKKEAPKKTTSKVAAKSTAKKSSKK